MFSENNFHLVGIGGIGMSGLARILRENGKEVSGSDCEDSPIVAKLRAEGFEISIPQSVKNLPKNSEVVIHTLAADSENPEISAASERGLRILSYPEALGEITKNKKLIAIAGTHGKTTTTGLIISACLNAGEDISCLVGANLQELGDKNARVGNSEWFVLEACEYRRAFLNLQPQILAITNIEAEHLDFYKNLEDYESAFVEFAEKLPTNGVLVADSREPNLEKTIAAAPHFFDAGNALPSFSLKIPGEMNRRNARLAFVLAELLNLDSEKARAGIENFAGAERRMEFRGEFRGAKIYDDYAHHPTEIQATLATAREEFPDSRIVMIYQQHQISRAQKMLRQLGESFFDADVVVIPNIYEVRDEANSKNKISGKDLAAEIRKNGKEVFFTENFNKTVIWLRENLQKNDIAVIAGAGDVWKITEKLLEN
ncbi:UDP-N-acetylmuramate--L-alanine ligase [Patescibacteria group bacterium]|nr:UDP-N-acetylmuramate--L-alanine ligase [Patescibacteria group bacterium]